MKDTVKRNAHKIVKRLQEAGFKAYIAGGAVRDMVMSIDPEDYDIATDASLSDVARLFKRVIPLGKKFGVSLVVLGGKPYEISNLIVYFTMKSAIQQRKSLNNEL